MVRRVSMVLLVVLSLVLAACGAAGTGSTGSPTQAATQAQSPSQAASSSPASTPAQLTKLTVGLPTAGALQWPFYVALAKGWYRDAGIDLEQVSISNGSQGVQGLVSGSLGLYTASPDPVIIAIGQTGAKLKLLGGVVDRPLYSLVVQPEVQNYEDLRGKRLGVYAELSMESAWLQMMLKSHGLNKGDYELVQIGGTSARYAALTSKGIAGTMLTQPQDFQAIRLGYRRLGLSTEVISQIAWSSYATSTDFAEKNEDLLVRFLGVQRKASMWLNDPANKDEAISILMANTKSQQSDAEQTYQLWMENKSLTPDSSETPEAIKTMIDMLVTTQQLKSAIPVEDVFDPSYMEKAKARG